MPEEVWQVRYIDYDYWVALSRGSRLPRDAASTIRAGTRIFNVPNDGFLTIAEQLRAGARLPELILVRAQAGAPLVVLEGHVRLTAYALAPETLPAGLRVLVGTAPGFKLFE